MKNAHKNITSADSLVFPVDYTQSPFSAGVSVTGTFVATYNIEVTNDDVYDLDATIVWRDPSGTAADFTGLTATADVNIVGPIMAVRINPTSYSSGTLVFNYQQGRSS